MNSQVENYDLKSAAQRKGIPYKTLSNDPSLQPRLGYAIRRIRSKKYYSHAEITRWVDVFDSNLNEYIEELIEEAYPSKEAWRNYLSSLRNRGFIDNDLWKKIKVLL
jgi:hypothetical protein